jgi:endonuclease/exonuclease/phosphatase family metal-dependent hydrolase
MRRLLPPIAAALLVVACSTSDNTGPTQLPGADAQLGQAATSWEAIVANAGPGAMPIKVYAQNVYPGFDIDKVEAALGGPPDAALAALTNALLVFDATNWRERAARMALAISEQDPDVVVLNELVTVRREGFQTVSVFLEGTPFEPFAPYWAQIPDAAVDFLPVFQEELAKLGLRYDLVATLPLTNIRIDLPYFPVPVFVQYDDRDAMFVRSDVQVGEVAVDTFAVTLQTVALQSRGWIAADVEVHGKPWHVVGTHPAPNWPTDGKTPQITELIGAVAGVARPVVIAGDLNLLPGSAEYVQLATAGFADLWTLRNGRSPAEFTCCHGDDETLREPSDGLEKRIDYILARPASGYAVGPVPFTIFGDNLSERTATGMWPSDHAGLFAGLVLQKTHTN